MDETKVPSIKLFLDEGETEWINPRVFTSFKGIPLNKAVKVGFKYDFEQDPACPKTISVKGSLNTIVKDKLVVLDIDGIGYTQIAFNSNVVALKVADPDKKYPLTFFTNKSVTTETYEWLDA
jgi:hypothetical protein